MKPLDQMIEKFNGLDVKIRVGVFLVFLAFVFGADYFLVMRWQMGFIKSTKEEIETTEQNIAQVGRDKQRIDQIKNGRETINGQLLAMSKKIRSVGEVPVILQEISLLAGQVDLAPIDQILPQKQGQELLLKTPEGNYYSLPIVIQARSGYHKFGRFLNLLEKADLYFSIREFKLEANDKDPGNLSIYLVIKVVLIDKNPPPEVKK